MPDLFMVCIGCKLVMDIGLRKIGTIDVVLGNKRAQLEWQVKDTKVRLRLKVYWECILVSGI